MAYRDKFSTKLTYAPLTLVALAAMVPPELNAKIDICDEMVQSFSYDTPYDIVAISFVTSSAARAYKIAEKFRSKGSFVVFGGYHTTFMPDEAALHADSIIVGPAERAFPQFLRDYADKDPQPRLRSCCCLRTKSRVEILIKMWKHSSLTRSKARYGWFCLSEHAIL